jgi:hypothetical protein
MATAIIIGALIYAALAGTFGLVASKNERRRAPQQNAALRH